MKWNWALIAFKVSNILQNRHFLVLSDNCTAISNMKKFGNMQYEQRDQNAGDIWEFVTNMNSWLSISFIPGVLNKDADLALRVINCRTEWNIPLYLYKQICIHLEFLPHIDPFVSRLNYRLKRFYSYSPDPKCEHVDSFTVPWNKDSYAFLPIIWYKDRILIIVNYKHDNN